ncbi:hypothetical protein ACHAXT_008098 [Thalassiosira profunda]
MVQVTNFLLRWLFLCRLVDDRAEVQTWPYRRPGYYEHPPQHQPQHSQQNYEGQSQQVHPQDVHHPQHEPQRHQQHQHVIEDGVDIPAYRESVIRSITSYPPGSSERLQKLEELRLQTVREFAKRLVHADEVIRWGAVGHQNEREEQDGRAGRKDAASTVYEDADDSIQEDLQQFMQHQHKHSSLQASGPNIWKRWHFLRGHHANEGDGAAESTAIPASLQLNPLQGLTLDQIESSVANAQILLAEARAFLPQLVSTVLHSPPALLPENVFPDPISSLRSLLIHRCQTNPSLGIELCWLLEAEVGRKWKALFEHRQQTGKRLILIVQADIAAAIATIGAEKASAFNLLQDAEMATAFGMERRYEDQHMGGGHSQQPYHPSVSSHASAAAEAADASPRPPRSISDLRCRHFGDSMHFVDRLTQISLDLRQVPPVHRQAHLALRLSELNRRLCRRMITQGRISIDVEDSVHASVPQWSEESIREDMIKHSVHFPMEPQCVQWPGASDNSAAPSDFERPKKRNGVVRALRILPNDCRVLDSASRCPFLVRMEVAETGLDADDARLYASDVPGGVGLTIQESLGSVRPHGNSIMGNAAVHGPEQGGFAPCEIPPELMSGQEHYRAVSRSSSDDSTSQGSYGAEPRRPAFVPSRSGGHATRPSLSGVPRTQKSSGAAENKAVLSRGGYQGGHEGYYDHHDPFDMVREQYYEELHHDLRQQRENEFVPADTMALTTSSQLSTGSALLDQVFGRQWKVECEQIRQQSPYRNVKGWRLASFIIKAGEDNRKEALVMQIMSKLWTWFQTEIPPHLRPFLRPYTIMCVGGDAGIVECLPDVKSVNEVKKETDGFTTLLNFFERAYGPPAHPPYQPQQPHQDSPITFEKARDNFLRSLVGYSIVCYVLQIKDRHNANILMDREGHIMHIDFGFVLGETPKMGKVPLFSERAPFKLSAEFWEVIGGWSAFKRFCEMFEAAYAVAASHSDEICSLVEAAIMNVSRNTDLARSIADSVRGRIQMKADPKEQKMHIMNIVNDAITSWGTSTYDWLQRSMHGYQ